jgi:hypothetical protein
MQEIAFLGLRKSNIFWGSMPRPGASLDLFEWEGAGV